MAVDIIPLRLSFRLTPSLSWGSLILMACLTTPLVPAQQPQTTDAEAAEKQRIAIEALSRLEGVDIHQNPALKKAVENVLKTATGTPDFVRLVKKFKMTDQKAGLLAYAANHPSEEIGVEAMKLVLDYDGENLIRQTLQGADAQAAAQTATALGNTSDQRAVPLLRSVVVSGDLKPEVRKAAVPALTRTQAGAKALLDLARTGDLSQDLTFTSAQALASVRWAPIKQAAAEVLPPPQGSNAKPLPPVAELLKRKGDIANGRKVYHREGPNCINCHRIKGEGRDVGPDLSGIGAKLGKEALYEAILDPSAGISFGYEAHELELKSGDEAYGLIVSETGSEITIKDTQGVVTRHKKADILERRKMSLSIMPSGLQLTMNVEELVDLVEFLASLK